MIDRARRLLSGLVVIGVMAMVVDAQSGEAVKPLTQPIVLIAHRGGEPDNTLEGIERSIAVGVTAVEIDVRPTADGRLVLSHDASLPRSRFFPDAAPNEKIAIARTAFDVLSSLRYTADVNGTKLTGLRIPSLDAVMEKCLPRVNLDLHVAPETPIQSVLQIVARHRACGRVLIHSDNLTVLQEARQAEPRLNVLWPQSLLGRHEVDGKWPALPPDQQRTAYEAAIEEFSKIGGGILCTKTLSPELVRLCHAHGILAMPSSYQVKDGPAEEWLKIGVDVIMGDSPEAMRKGVERVLGPDYLPAGNRDIADILRDARSRR